MAARSRKGTPKHRFCPENSWSTKSRVKTPSTLEPKAKPRFHIEHIEIADQVEREFYFVDKPDQDLYCPVTLEILLEPHQTDCCGQHISEKAANRIIKDGKPCPMCKDAQFMTHRDKYFKRNTVKTLRVYCLHKKSGCEWTGELGDLNNHSTSCPKRPWKCQYCGLEFTFDVGTNEHTPNCAQYPLPCPNQCEIGTVPRCDAEKHLLVCPLQLVECEFGCDAKVVRRDLDRHMLENARQHFQSATIQMSRSVLEVSQVLFENVQHSLMHIKHDLGHVIQAQDAQIGELRRQAYKLETKIKKDVDTKVDSRWTIVVLLLALTALTISYMYFTRE